MACNKCNQPTPQHTGCGCNETTVVNHICDECPPESPCECPVKDLSTDCVLYTGNDLLCNDTKVILKNTILTVALKNIIDFFCQKLQEINNKFKLINVGGGIEIYSGNNLLGERKLRTLISTDDSVSIEEGTDTIDFKVGTIGFNNVGDGAEVYKNTTTTHNFKTLKVGSVEGDGESLLSSIDNELPDNNSLIIKSKKIFSDSLDLSETDGIIKINIPSSFEGTDYYVNINYSGQEEKGTVSKPFKTLKRCLDIILNRAYQNNALVWVESPNPDINGGIPYKKYQPRDRQVKVIIQTNAEILENASINNVIYEIQNGSFISTSDSLDYIFNMKPLIDDLIADGQLVPVLNTLPYHVKTYLQGDGVLFFSSASTNRRGFVKTYGYSNGNPNLEQNDCEFYLGNSNSSINFLMFKRPDLLYSPLLEIDNITPITREGVPMQGYQQTSTPDYGAIQVEGRNSIFGTSLFYSGNIVVQCFEQHGIYHKNGGVASGDNGSLEVRRGYQMVNYDSIDEISQIGFRFYTPSKFVYDIYLKEASIFSYVGTMINQQNSDDSQGGAEAYICVENSTTNPLNFSSVLFPGGGKIKRYYNHFVKQILHPSLSNFQQNFVTLEGFTFSSSLYEDIINFVDTSDISALQSNSFLTLRNCIINNKNRFGVNLPFSNVDLETVLILLGTIVGLSNGFLVPELPSYIDNSDALGDNYPKGGFYKESLTNDIKVVI